MLVIRYLAKKLNESQAVRKDKQEIAEVLRASDLEEFRNSFNESMKREIRQLRESVEEMKQAVMEHARGATSAEVGVTVARHSQ